MSNFFNQIQISKLFKVNYLLDATPKSDGLYQYSIIIFGLLGLVTLLLWFFSRNKQKLTREFFKKIITLFITTAILGIICIFLRSQEIPYLGSRLVLLILIFMFIIWGGFILYFRIMVMPKKIKNIKEKEEFEKYLPKSKGNKK
jgi:hypothetical protein